MPHHQNAFLCFEAPSRRQLNQFSIGAKSITTDGDSKTYGTQASAQRRCHFCAAQNRPPICKTLIFRLADASTKLVESSLTSENSNSPFQKERTVEKTTSVFFPHQATCLLDYLQFSEIEMVFIRHYDPESIFPPNNKSGTRGLGVEGDTNRRLAKTFLDELLTEGDNSMNAGAVQLYKNGKLVGPSISYRSTGGDLGPLPHENLGHSEKRLMVMVLDACPIIQEDSDVRKPCDIASEKLEEEQNETDLEIEALKVVVEQADEYRQFLTKNGIIVKMWSERKPCEDCDEFINNIFPEGSHYGYICTRYDDESLNTARKKYRDAFQQSRKTRRT